MSIWITQVLCENRHCLQAQPWDDATLTRESMAQLAAQIDELFAKFPATTECALCHSTKIHTEHARTLNFTSVHEATARMSGAAAMTQGTGNLLEQIGAEVARAMNDASTSRRVDVIDVCKLLQ